MTGSRTGSLLVRRVREQAILAGVALVFDGAAGACQWQQKAYTGRSPATVTRKPERVCGQ